MKLKKAVEVHEDESVVSKKTFEESEDVVKSSHVSKTVSEAAEEKGTTVKVKEVKFDEIETSNESIVDMSDKSEQQTIKVTDQVDSMVEKAQRDAVDVNVVSESDKGKVTGIPPSFVTKPQSISVIEGETIVLQCKVKG